VRDIGHCTERSAKLVVLGRVCMYITNHMKDLAVRLCQICAGFASSAIGKFIKHIEQIEVLVLDW